MASEATIITIAQLALRAGMSLGDATREFRWAVIESALAMTKGNRMQAARVLSIHRNTLSRELGMMALKGRVIKRRPYGIRATAKSFQRGA